MIGLAIYLNRRRLTVAAAEDLALLSATVIAMGQLGKSTAWSGKRTPNLRLSVSALTCRSGAAEDERLTWIGTKRLRVGDKVTVQVVRTEKPDRHESATVASSRRHQAKRRMQKRTRFGNTP